MANISQIKKITKATFINPVILYNKQLTKFFKDGLWDMNLKGLRILNNLTIFTNPKELPSKLISIMEKKTITKSNLFQDSLI